MPTLVLLRHGQSQWNRDDRFTGWVDVDLTEEGEAQARRAGDLMLDNGLAFDRAHTSVLTRAIRTGCLALAAAGQLWIPMAKTWRLNERHYGGLTGLNKAQTVARHGEEQVRVWRRSYDQPPPPAPAGGEFDFSRDRRYAGIAPPHTESLKTTLDRVLPYFAGEIVPGLAAGETVLVAAHGNSLRAIVKHLFGLSETAVVSVEIPTGNPLLIELDPSLTPTSAVYLDAERAAALP